MEPTAAIGATASATALVVHSNAVGKERIGFISLEIVNRGSCPNHLDAPDRLRTQALAIEYEDVVADLQRFQSFERAAPDIEGMFGGNV